MRLDKFLKVSRLVKRRPIAKELADAGRVLINGQVAKASSEVKVGDRLDLQFGQRPVALEIVELRDFAKKEEASALYRALTSPDSSV